MKMNLITTNFIPAGDVKIPDIYYNRLKTGFVEVDDFLGGQNDTCGGFLRGGVYIIAAGAGSGKSTFCLQMSEAFVKKGYRVAYASGEESIEQLAFTCRRLGVSSVPIAVQSDLDTLCEKMKDLDIIIIDSFQTISVKKHLSSRKKELLCIATICQKAKQYQCTVIALCHLTKAGIYKGSTAVLHGVDACINLHVDEEDPGSRIFTWSKNRFGPADREMMITLTRNGYDFTTHISHTSEIVKPKKPVQLVTVESKFDKFKNKLS